MNTISSVYLIVAKLIFCFIFYIASTQTDPNNGKNRIKTELSDSALYHYWVKKNDSIAYYAIVNDNRPNNSKKVFQEKIIDNTFFILNSDTIFLKVDKKACYLPKCESSLEAHISKYKRKLEEDDIEYKLGLSFIIFKNGSAKYCGIHTQFYDMRYINSCTAIFNNMESWNPAIKNAKTVSSVYGVIINFSEE